MTVTQLRPAPLVAELGALGAVLDAATGVDLRTVATADLPGHSRQWPRWSHV